MDLHKDDYRLQGIGQLFVLEQLLEQAKAVEFYKNASKENLSLVQYLDKNNILSAQQMAHTAAQGFGVPMLDINCIDLKSIPINLVDEKLIRDHRMLPLISHGSNLYLATDDPSKQHSLKEIQFHTGLKTHAIVVETDKLSYYMEQLLAFMEHQSLSEYVGDSSDSIIDEAEQHHASNSIIDDAPIVQFVNKIILTAIEQGSSDIHFEPYENAYRIRYRQDGILHEVVTPSVNLSSRIAARIKVMANLDIAERRIPQDGGFKMRLSKTRSIDFRVSTCPTASGEKVVIRILDPDTATLGIEALGFDPMQQEHFVKAINRPQGMILVTGPTGSGKTVSLYTALNKLNTKEVNISTAEDPIEIKISGINQVQVNPKAGLTFSSILRSFLRQDPDIIMVGEIRDLETAEIAVNAAQTGHLVLSTLHTNSAAETLNRLINMGIPTFNIASSLSLIIAQRLARKLCDQCKVIRDDYSTTSLIELGFTKEEINDIKLYQAVGCTQCTNGYKGRIGLFEVMPITRKLGELIMSYGNSLDILKTAELARMQTLMQSGLAKVKQGITTLEEINRVTVD